jgi:hypothetical protein
MTKTPDKKTHADFQSRYRRSFNFRNESKNNKLVLDENGKLVLVQQKDE